MKNDTTVVKILSNPKLRAYFKYLKTSEWRKLKRNNIENFYFRFNKTLCKALNIDCIDIKIGENELGNNSFLDQENYKNIYINYDGEMCINNINYNQYLTMYEYLYRVRLHLSGLQHLSKYDMHLDDEKLNQLNDNFRNVNYGEISIKVDKDDGEEYEEYQFINKDAREFAEEIMFIIVNQNYDFSDGYDEEQFMNNCNILDNQYLSMVADYFIDAHIDSKTRDIYEVNQVRKKIKMMEKKNLSYLEDSDLFFIVYPDIIRNSDPVCIINGFNEIIKRIYDDNLVISWKRDSLYINKNKYSINDIDNLFNIVLYECLNDMEKKLRKNPFELEEYKNGLDLNKAIENYKKKWVYSVIYKVDSSSQDYKESSVFKKQSLYRLLNKEQLQAAISKTSKNYFPLKKKVGGK